ncbi:MAG: hypothetical protein RLZZ584_2385 [Pseudomonadota bacterium]|jgi:hypothetical protein
MSASSPEPSPDLPSDPTPDPVAAAASAAPVDPATLPPLSLGQRRRLRQLWRNAGWPCHDTTEVELLAAGLITQAWDAHGRLNLRLTGLGIQALTHTLQRNRRAFDAHEALVARVAEQMQRAGRLVWCGLSLRAPLSLEPAVPRQPSSRSSALEGDGSADAMDGAVDGEQADQAAAAVTGADAAPAAAAPPASPPFTPDLLAGAWPESGELHLPAPAAPRHRWAMAMPDVFSIRLTSVEDYVEPAIHEIKVSRADLQSDLRKPAKGRAYLALAGQCWYVCKAGIAEVDEIPPEFGVLFAHDDRLELARPAPRRPMKLSFAHWMVLARATPLARPEESLQQRLDGGLDLPDE